VILGDAKINGWEQGKIGESPLIVKKKEWQSKAQASRIERHDYRKRLPSSAESGLGKRRNTSFKSKLTSLRGRNTIGRGKKKNGQYQPMAPTTGEAA